MTMSSGYMKNILTIVPMLFSKYLDSKPSSSKLLFNGSVGLSCKASFTKSLVSKKSNAAIQNRLSQNFAALVGKTTSHKGSITISYCVLTIDHNCCNEAERAKFRRKMNFEPSAVFESDSIATTSAVAIGLCFGTSFSKSSFSSFPCKDLSSFSLSEFGDNSRGKPSSERNIDPS